VFLRLALFWMVLPLIFLACAKEEPVMKADETFLNEVIEEYSKQDKNIKNEKILFWSVTPDGEVNLDMPRRCTEKAVFKALQGKTGEDFQSELDGLTESCERHWHSGKPSGLLALLATQRLDYEMNENREIQRVVVKTKSGIKIRGYTGFKPGKKLPLVVIKCGVFCSGTATTAAKLAFFKMFDMSPYHVLYLANRTGRQWVLDNEILTVGGIGGGRDMIEAGMWARDHEEFGPMITDMYALGISLGGHAAIYASLFNSKMKEPVFKASIAMCPVLNLKPTLHELFKDGIIGSIAYSTAWKEVDAVREAVPGVQQHMPEKKPDPSVFIPKLGEISKMYHEHKRPEFDGMFSLSEIETLEDYWNVNSINNWHDQITTPTLVAYSEDDPIVDPGVNSISLQSVAGSNENIQFWGLKTGSHCAVGPSYGWGLVASVFHSFIQAHSEKDPWMVEVEVMENLPFNTRMYGQERISGFHFDFKKNKEYVTLKASVEEDYCHDEPCDRTISGKIPFEYLPEELNIFKPTTDAEAEALGRRVTRFLTLQGYREKRSARLKSITGLGLLKKFEKKKVAEQRAIASE
jgi:predicted alpha/beta-fold hydrolase